MVMKEIKDEDYDEHVVASSIRGVRNFGDYHEIFYSHNIFIDIA